MSTHFHVTFRKFLTKAFLGDWTMYFVNIKRKKVYSYTKLYDINIIYSEKKKCPDDKPSQPKFTQI